MENKNDLLTVKEFALAAGVSRQTVYNRLDKDLTGDLTRYLTEIDSVKYIDRAALQFFKSNLDSQIDSGFDNNLTGFDSNLTALQQLIDTQAAEIERLQDQLQAKDQQISFLQAHIDKQQQTIDSLTAALTAAQTLQAMEKQERLQLTDQGAGLDPTPGGDQSQGETEGAPAPEPVKRKLWERIFKRK